MGFKELIIDHCVERWTLEVPSPDSRPVIALLLRDISQARDVAYFIGKSQAWSDVFQW